MSKQPLSNEPVYPLSIGNIISASLRIYRDHFKLYFSLAFKAYLWIFVPVYGWAKWSALNALIARLAFGEVREQPETVSEAQNSVDPKMWNIFLAGILVNLIFGGFFILGIIIFAIFFAVLAGIIAGFGTALGSASSQGGIIAIVALSLFGILVFIGFMFGYLWLYTHLSIFELPIVIEENVDSTSSISRSWKLTEGFVTRLQLLFVVAFLVTLPISIFVQVISSASQAILMAIFQDSPTAFLFPYYLVVIIISVLSGSLVIPFWQSIKAVIYYDLRSRKEGLGLQIRDSL
ncbi:DUF975 domain-containing protein [Lusitaniella coriacea]|uniref:DUF975 domain-containing protein n=1 Tax=Lusitaniella coriacea TaxID=1983105 RepID=UPI003CF72DD2